MKAKQRAAERTARDTRSKMKDSRRQGSFYLGVLELKETFQIQRHGRIEAGQRFEDGNAHRLLRIRLWWFPVQLRPPAHDFLYGIRCANGFEYMVQTNLDCATLLFAHAFPMSQERGKC